MINITSYLTDTYRESTRQSDPRANTNFRIEMLCNLKGPFTQNDYFMKKKNHMWICSLNILRDVFVHKRVTHLLIIVPVTFYVIGRQSVDYEVRIVSSSFKDSNDSNYFRSPDDVIENGRRDLEQSRDISNISNNIKEHGNPTKRGAGGSIGPTNYGSMPMLKFLLAHDYFQRLFLIGWKWCFWLMWSYVRQFV